MKRDWRELTARADWTLREVITLIDRGNQKLAIVVDGSGHLLGTISDGDIRRALLRGETLEALAVTVMNHRPAIGSTVAARSDLVQLMRAKRISAVPIVDEDMRLIGLEYLESESGGRRHDNLVVLMAGGKGQRLLPLTEKLPKPLIQVAGRPILEIIIRRFAAQGFWRFAISVNFLGHIIKEHFGDGSQLGVSISYIEEGSSLGTAGSLGLLTETPDRAVLVSNGDLLTKLKYDWMLDFHLQHGASATVAVREYDMQVPFGVVGTQDGFVTQIDEKPVHRFFISAGVYILEPSVFDLVAKDERVDMPQVLQRLISRLDKVAAFPLRERWLDIGRHDDLERAEAEFEISEQDEPEDQLPVA
ncbi:Nucleotidyl transferase [Methylorubrum extorquens CM4]|uniref:Nucleotidyl transferase n=1 Tax=Methylorubrum extorquens (strain CM4 / NCIMB 13688) TaxID=440085 RepID=B7KYN3_METC4|nr:Nucleotidyl transferase [Methylorubrum extorquens CM4]